MHRAISLPLLAALLSLPLAGCGTGETPQPAQRQPPPVDPAGLPDLVPALAPGQTEHYYSQVMDGVRVYLSNVGTGPAQDCVVRVRYGVTWLDPFMYVDETATTGVIPAGVTTSVFVAPPPDTLLHNFSDFELDVYLDTRDDVAESDESNNVVNDIYE